MDRAAQFEQRIKMAVGDLRAELLTDGVEVTWTAKRNGNVITVTIGEKAVTSTKPAILVDDDDNGEMD